jgi:hypothetical protein
MNAHTSSERIDYSRFTSAESSEVVRQIDPRRELRVHTDRERVPDYYQQREGRMEWSGGSWSGRSR